MVDFFYIFKSGYHRRYICNVCLLGAVAFNPGVINTDMLRSTFGDEADEYENPNEWAMHAVSKLEALSPSDSGNTVIG